MSNGMRIMKTVLTASRRWQKQTHFQLLICTSKLVNNIPPSYPRHA